MKRTLVSLMIAAFALVLSFAPRGRAGETNSVRIRVEVDPTGRPVSHFLATANCHGARGHCPDNAAWD